MAEGGKSKSPQTKSWKTVQTQVQTLTKKAQEIRTQNAKSTR